MLCRITGQMCTAWSDVAGCGLVRCKFVEEKGGDKMVTDSRKSCPMRHESGNCTVAGGFCTAVNDPVCEALHNAFDCGYRSSLRQQEHFREVTKKVEPLTLDDLNKRNDPVFLPIKDFPNGGYWCLCENGYIIPPNGYGFMAKDRPNWVFYSQKPEDDDHDERKENEHV